MIAIDRFFGVARMPSHFQGNESEVRALSALINLVRAAESVMGRLNSQFHGLAITQSQFNALDSLYHLGPLSQKELGEKLFKTSGNITMVVDNLEKQGLARRERNEEDRRQISVILTEKGRETIEILLPVRVWAIEKEMASLTPAEQEQLGELCRKLGKKEIPKEETSQMGTRP